MTENQIKPEIMAQFHNDSKIEAENIVRKWVSEVKSLSPFLRLKSKEEMNILSKHPLTGKRPGWKKAFFSGEHNEFNEGYSFIDTSLFKEGEWLTGHCWSTKLPKIQKYLPELKNNEKTKRIVNFHISLDYLEYDVDALLSKIYSKKILGESQMKKKEYVPNCDNQRHREFQFYTVPVNQLEQKIKEIPESDLKFKQYNYPGEIKYDIEQEFEIFKIQDNYIINYPINWYSHTAFFKVRITEGSSINENQLEILENLILSEDHFKPNEKMIESIENYKLLDSKYYD